MRKMIIICDICGKTISADAYKMTVGIAQQDTALHGEPRFVSMVPESMAEKQKEIESADFCEDCMRQLTDMLIDIVKANKHEQAAEETKADGGMYKVFVENGINYMNIPRKDTKGKVKTFKLDASKYVALMDSGWKREQMKREFSLDGIEQCGLIENAILTAWQNKEWSCETA